MNRLTRVALDVFTATFQYVAIALFVYGIIAERPWLTYIGLGMSIVVAIMLGMAILFALGATAWIPIATFRDWKALNANERMLLAVLSIGCALCLITIVGCLAYLWFT
jgi:hypothetical protein